MAVTCVCAVAATINWMREKIMARLLERYRTEIVPHLQKELGHSNVYQVPRISRVVLNMGLGEAIQNAKALDAAVAEMTAIAGQKPVVTKARQSISNFKLREGMSIGCMVTLRGTRMFEFLDRLMNVALPRVRDFRGVSDRSFDGRGNYSLGIREQIIFPEIDLDKIEKVRGLTVSIVTTARSDAEGKALLKALGMPFRA
jgi:large subunit ribosomal protein L5